MTLISTESTCFFQSCSWGNVNLICFSGQFVLLQKKKLLIQEKEWHSIGRKL